MGNSLGTMFSGLLDEHVGNTAEQRQARVAAQARNAGFYEIQASTLKPWRQFLADRVTGTLYQVVTHQVMENGQREGDAFRFYVDEGARGGLVFLDIPSGPRTIAEVLALEYEEARGYAEAAKAKTEAYAQLPQREITLRDLEGRKFPTVAAAAKTIADYGGGIEKKGGELHIHVPEDLARRSSVLDAVRVIAAAERIVVEALSHRSAKPLHERLPDSHISVTGTLC
jgi:hypothetical protein